MKTIELVKCEDYIIEQVAEYQSKDTLQGMANIIAEGAVLDRVSKYARLLKQPLTLGMFVPCDEDGNLMHEPNAEFCRSTYDCSYYNYDWKRPYEKAKNQYQQALDRVIFEGFEIVYAGRKNIVIENEERYCSLTFLKNGSEVAKEFQKEYGNYKSISDLCGYGLKIKMIRINVC